MTTSPYIRLKANFALRGWKGLPYALVDRNTGTAAFMREEVFRTVRLCNGGFTAESPVFMGERKHHLRELERLGFLERLNAPGELAPGQEYRFHDNRYVQLVLWSVTGRCNYRCRHCYMSAPRSVLPHPTTEQCLAMVDQIAECGIQRVSLTGGEPLVRGDFLQIVERLLERGMQLEAVMTNGALVDEALLDELAARGCRPMFHMSLDGPRQWHDWLRGVDGAYDNVRRAFTLCHERGFATGCGMVLHKGNLHTLRECVRDLGEWGASSLKVGRMRCIGEGESLREYAITAQEEYEAFLQYIPQYLEDGMPVPYLKLLGLFDCSGGRLSVDAVRNPEGGDCNGCAICSEARSSIYLGSDGRVLPCVPMGELDCTARLFPLASETGLAEALSAPAITGFLATTLGEYREHNPRCGSCAFGNRCGGGCRGYAVMANGGADLLGRDPDTCTLFRGGYYDRVQDIIAQHQGAASGTTV